MTNKIKIIDILCYISTGDYDKLPNEFKYRDKYFLLNKDNGYDYWSDEIGGWFSVEFLGLDNLNDEVEILDEEDKFEDIEEFVFGEVEDAAHYEMKDKINQLIKNQKKIISRLKEEGK